DGEQADQRRPRPGAEHHLQAALEGEHLRVEPGAGDDVGQEVLDVVQAAGVGERVGQVEDLLLEQELFLVVEHGRMVHAFGALLTRTTCLSTLVRWSAPRAVRGNENGPADAGPCRDGRRRDAYG